MALDGCTLHFITNEIIEKAQNSRIERITMPFKDRLVLSLSAPGFNGKLLISCNPSYPRINFTNEKFENPITPPMLCMLLRKKMTGGRLVSIKQVGFDRILFLDFECKNELGDNVLITIAVEIMGRLSNIIIIQEGKIIDSVRRFDPEEGKRFILPGAKYELPPTQNKLNIINTDADIIINKIKSGNDMPLSKALCSIIDGISPLIGREIAFRCTTFADVKVSDLDNVAFEELARQIKAFKDVILEGGNPVIIMDKGDIPKDFTFMDIQQYGSMFHTIKCEDYSSLLDVYYAKKDLAENMRIRSSSLLKLLTNLSQRITRKINNRQQDLTATQSREKLRIYGELIKANLHVIKAGDSYIEAVNYYDPQYKKIKIPLDSALSPSRNAQKYFKDYKKANTAANMLEQLINSAQQELLYIQTVLEALKRANSISELAAIKHELIESGYLKSSSKKPVKNIKGTPLKYFSTDGFTIYVGKNNYQNDQLTLKIASKDDLWLHTKNIPGSHVIIEANGSTIPDSTIEQAAILAALNSKASQSKQVPVDYTLVRYVKKPNKAKPGMVIYKNNKTAFVDPTEDIYQIVQN